MNKKQKTDIASLDFPALIELRDYVIATIQSKVDEQRKSLLAQQAELDKLSGKVAKRGVKKGTKIAPKYKGPNGETWAGRGQMPEWLKSLKPRMRMQYLVVNEK